MSGAKLREAALSALRRGALRVVEVPEGTLSEVQGMLLRDLDAVPPSLCKTYDDNKWRHREFEAMATMGLVEVEGPFVVITDAGRSRLRRNAP